MSKATTEKLTNSVAKWVAADVLDVLPLNFIYETDLTNKNLDFKSSLLSVFN